MLRSVAALSVAGAVKIKGIEQIVTAQSKSKTLPMSQSEMEAVDAALGKKGKYVEAEAVYTVPLPRNDLEVSIRGEAVPISFGFGGWVSVSNAKR